MKERPIKAKSFDFAIRILKLVKYLQDEKGEYVLSKQVLRSGTAIGALVREAEYAESRADFIHKMAIALKETNETLYWLDLLGQSDYIAGRNIESLRVENEELLKLLTAIVKTSKKSKAVN
jgi:four helix bundle protein